ncbi:MAG: hypothetical protein IPG92_12005 [Flavobacteriales bacterium]|nr:hypothetical protein [Flavobacteriales bacterium]
MKGEYMIRPAAAGDIPFLADAIMGAEASGTDKPGMAMLFDFSLERARELVLAMLEEEIDGCELSVSSFLVADTGNGPVAPVARMGGGNDR